MVSAEEFEAVIRAELAGRDKRRRARLLDPVVYAEADQLCVNAIMRAAGYDVPDDSGHVVRKARRARRDNEEAALGAT
jgi:hypothetical protein